MNKINQILPHIILGSYCAFLIFVIGFLVGINRYDSFVKNRMSKVLKDKSWLPEVGEKVLTVYTPKGFTDEPYLTTVTKVVVGGASQSGILVYSDDLPGVDLWWVKQAKKEEQ